jgi:hypothetical protein
MAPSLGFLRLGNFDLSKSRFSTYFHRVGGPDPGSSGCSDKFRKFMNINLSLNKRSHWAQELFFHPRLRGDYFWGIYFSAPISWGTPVYGDASPYIGVSHHMGTPCTYQGNARGPPLAACLQSTLALRSGSRSIYLYPPGGRSPITGCMLGRGLP